MNDLFFEARNAFAKLLPYDQLSFVRNQNLAFSGFHESPITFPPTYKFLKGQSEYDDRKDHRIRTPAWCDRILFQQKESLQGKPLIETQVYNWYGDVYISEEVLEMIAGAAALEVDGVTGLAGGTMSEQILGRKKLSKGITILWESDNITINVSIQIRYGGIIPELAKKVQEAIVTSVEATSGLKVAAVNVRVGGVTFDKPEE